MIKLSSIFNLFFNNQNKNLISKVTKNCLKHLELNNY